jgi:transcriptional regulator with XRE-family HTH domain
MNLHLFFERLREERERLGLTQDEVVKATGISKRSYCAYEAGDTTPNAKFLASLIGIGMDVSYLLTGQRSQPLAPQALLPKSDRALLDDFHHASHAVQKLVKETLGTFTPPVRPSDQHSSQKRH